MKRDRAIELVGQQADALKARGIAHVYLFGSTARNQARSGSDIDLYFDLRRGSRFSLFDLVELRDYLGKVLKVRADAIPRRGLHRKIRRQIEQDSVRIF